MVMAWSVDRLLKRCILHSRNEDAAKIQLSSCSGPQPLQSGAPSRHSPGLQTKTSRRADRDALGADAGSASPYIRSRGKGEKAVREAFPATTLIRPSIMFGRGDAFLIPITRMLRRLPAFPLFGRGQTQLQPAYVEDVADAIARVMQNAQ